MNKVYEESGVRFTFKDKAEVIKLDDEKVYRKVSHLGIKAVDFFLNQSGKIYLIEVKHWKYFDKTYDDKNNVNFEEILQDIIGKFVDSFFLCRCLSINMSEEVVFCLIINATEDRVDAIGSLLKKRLRNLKDLCEKIEIKIMTPELAEKYGIFEKVNRLSPSPLPSGL